MKTAGWSLCILLCLLTIGKVADYNVLIALLVEKTAHATRQTATMKQCATGQASVNLRRLMNENSKRNLCVLLFVADDW